MNLPVVRYSKGFPPLSSIADYALISALPPLPRFKMSFFSLFLKTPQQIMGKFDVRTVKME